MMCSLTSLLAPVLVPCLAHFKARDVLTSLFVNVAGGDRRDAHAVAIGRG
jgi:hypothetical protein